MPSPKFSVSVKFQRINSEDLTVRSGRDTVQQPGLAGLRREHPGGHRSRDRPGRYTVSAQGPRKAPEARPSRVPGRCSDRTPWDPRPSGRPGRVPPRDLGRPNLQARARGWASSFAAAPGSRMGPGAVTFTAPPPGRPAPERAAGPPQTVSPRGRGPGTRDPVSAAPRPRRTLTVQVSARRRARHKRDTAATPDMSALRSSQPVARGPRLRTSPRPGSYVAAPGVLRRRARGPTSPRLGFYVAAPGVLRRRARETGKRRACAEGLAGGGAQGTWSASSRPEVSWRLGGLLGLPQFLLISRQCLVFLEITAVL